MASRQKIIKALDVFLNDCIEVLFEGNNQYMYFNGVRYSREDFKNFITMNDTFREYFKGQCSSTTKYIHRRKDYHNTMVLLNYYVNKKNKKPSDFGKIEELQKKLDNIKKTHSEKRAIEKQIKKEEVQRLYDEYMNDKRRGDE